MEEQGDEFRTPCQVSARRALTDIVTHCQIADSKEKHNLTMASHASAWWCLSWCLCQGRGKRKLAARLWSQFVPTWLVSSADDGPMSTIEPWSLTDLPAGGWPSSTTTLRRHRRTFDRKERHHMVDRSTEALDMAVVSKCDGNQLVAFNQLQKTGNVQQQKDQTEDRSLRNSVCDW